MHILLKGSLLFILLTVTIMSCYSPINRSNVYHQYETNFETMSIGDSSFLKNETIWINRDLTGNGIHTRKVIYRDHNLLLNVIRSGSGKIYTNVCIDRKGIPVFVRIDYRTTIENKRTQEQALKMFAGYRFESNDLAQEFECGMLKLFLDVNAVR